MRGTTATERSAAFTPRARFTTGGSAGDYPPRAAPAEAAQAARTGRRPLSLAAHRATPPPDRRPMATAAAVYVVASGGAAGGPTITMQPGSATRGLQRRRRRRRQTTPPRWRRRQMPRASRGAGHWRRRQMPSPLPRASCHHHHRPRHHRKAALQTATMVFSISSVYLGYSETHMRTLFDSCCPMRRLRRWHGFTTCSLCSTGCLVPASSCAPHTAARMGAARGGRDVGATDYCSRSGTGGRHRLRRRRWWAWGSASANFCMHTPSARSFQPANQS